MRRSLTLRLLAGYVVFAALGFILVTTFTYQSVFSRVERQEASSLYREATQISANYAASYFAETATLEEIQRSLSTLSDYLSAEIWIVDSSGRIVSSTAATPASKEPEQIPGFDVTDFGSHYYQTGTFYGHFQMEMLSVFSPVAANYKVRGYVLIHKPVSSLVSQANGLTMIAYETLAIIDAIALAAILLYSKVAFGPIRKMADVADSYAAGDFEPTVNVRSNDEVGRIAASMNYMANELRTLEDDQRKFVSNVSHDFRSPLTSIKGYVEAMLDGTIPPESQEKYLGIILFETERLGKLTTSLLELGKFDSNGHGTMLDVTRFDINYTIRMTAQTFEGTCKQKRITIDLILTGDQLFVSADMGKIQQVLYNLIDNALKFSHPDSTVTVETTVKNEKIFVSVKDTGIGIPRESIPKIWDRFYKTDLSRGKDKRGTGLGLSIVKEIIQAHGENINCISTEGVGTEFIFTLPLA